MWREHAIFSCSAEQEIFGTLWRAGNSRDLGNAGRKLFDVRRDLGLDGAGGRSRRPAHALGDEWRGFLSLGDEPLVPLFAARTSMVAAGYGDVSARRFDSHRLQHDEPDAIRPGAGRTVWVRTLFVSLRDHGG